MSHPLRIPFALAPLLVVIACGTACKSGSTQRTAPQAAGATTRSSPKPAPAKSSASGSTLRTGDDLASYLAAHPLTPIGQIRAADLDGYTWGKDEFERRRNQPIADQRKAAVTSALVAYEVMLHGRSYWTGEEVRWWSEYDFGSNCYHFSYPSAYFSLRVNKADLANAYDRSVLSIDEYGLAKPDEQKNLRFDICFRDAAEGEAFQRILPQLGAVIYFRFTGTQNSIQLEGIDLREQMEGCGDLPLDRPCAAYEMRNLRLEK